MKRLIRWWMNFWKPLRTQNKLFLSGFATLVFLFAFFAVGYETVHYTESTEFCSSCHDVMEPEFAPHAISPHANVDCGSCHIGEGIGYVVYYKLMGLRYLYKLPLGLYERPLPTPRESMRTSEDTCENCHSSENFQGIKLVTDYNYHTDEANSLSLLQIAMKVGNGQGGLLGRGEGAHWHNENRVFFRTTDAFLQDIPWVAVERMGENGLERVEYIDGEADPSLWEDGELEELEMDCMTCHTRVGHEVQKPSELIDDALSREQISPDLPFIKDQATELLNVRYETEPEALATIEESINAFYQSNYPDLYQNRQADVEVAVDKLIEIYEVTNFPFMNVFWDTYPDNIGHSDFPGCMRCHDGNHLNEAQEPISADCSTCHSLPQVADPGQELEPISYASDDLPDSHQSGIWLAEHRYRFDATCDDCHSVANPGGMDNSSFCANSGCHASEWAFLDIDTERVMAMALAGLPEQDRKLPNIPHPIVEDMSCGTCHNTGQPLAYPENHIEFEDAYVQSGRDPAVCTDCHRLSAEVLADMPAQEIQLAAAWESLPEQASLINHPLMGYEDCAGCHAPTSNIMPAPATHAGFDTESCQLCHALSPEIQRSIEAAEFSTGEAEQQPVEAASTVVPAEEPTEEPTEGPTPEPTSEPTSESTPAPTEEPASEPTPEPEAEPTAASAVEPAEEPTEESEAASTESASTESASTEEASNDEISQIPAITHTLGWSDCVSCHTVESEQFPLPSDHATFQNNMCTWCHLPAAESDEAND